MAYSADSRADQLTAATTGASTDILLIQPGGTGDLKKITLANLGITATSSSALQIPALQVGGTDYGLARIAAGVGRISDGAAGRGWAQWAGQSYADADVTNATITMATTGLSVTLVAGRKYVFRAVLYLTESVAADGYMVGIDGGTATATNVFAHFCSTDETGLPSTGVITQALATQHQPLSVDGTIVHIDGGITVNAGGTFIVRFAKASHTTGTATLKRGSHLLVWDMP
jgi:hypothetical protein